MGKKEKVMEVLQEENLTAQEINERLSIRYTDFSNNIQEIRTYLTRLLKSDLVGVIGKKGGRLVYQSVFNKAFALLEEITTSKLPKKQKMAIYEVIVMLLPPYLKTHLDDLLKTKTKELRKREYGYLKEAKEEIRNLMYS